MVIRVLLGFSVGIGWGGFWGGFGKEEKGSRDWVLGFGLCGLPEIWAGLIRTQPTHFGPGGL